MTKLGLSTVEKRRKPETREAKPWTKAQTTALLGALGADASIESIAVRTCHSVKSVRAKLTRLQYEVQEIHGFAVFTVNSLADLLRVTPRQVRRWKERGWLPTNGGRITEDCLGEFFRAHSDRVPFETLRKEDQIYLADLGFPSPGAATFKKNVRWILEDIGRQRKPKRPVRREDAPAVEAAGSEEETEAGGEDRLTNQGSA
jgi:hypothetical protein